MTIEEGKRLVEKRYSGAFAEFGVSFDGKYYFSLRMKSDPSQTLKIGGVVYIGKADRKIGVLNPFISNEEYKRYAHHAEKHKVMFSR